MKRETWTVVPAQDVRELMKLTIFNKAGRSKRKRLGLRTKLVNDALRSFLSTETKAA